MAKMLGQDLFTQVEFDKFKKEYDELKIKVQLQGDEIHNLKQVSKAALALSVLSMFILIVGAVFTL